MKKTAVALAVAFVCLSFAPRAGAQQSTPPQDQCATPFWDRSTYNWLAYHNNCSQAIDLLVLSRNPGVAWEATIDPGTKGNTGISSNDINSHGGILAYVCFQGYYAADANGNAVTNGTSEYRCLHR